MTLSLFPLTFGSSSFSQPSSSTGLSMGFGDLALTSISSWDCALDLALWPFLPSTCSGGLPGATWGLSGPISGGGGSALDRGMFWRRSETCRTWGLEQQMLSLAPDPRQHLGLDSTLLQPFGVPVPIPYRGRETMHREVELSSHMAVEHVLRRIWPVTVLSSHGILASGGPALTLPHPDK